MIFKNQTKTLSILAITLLALLTAAPLRLSAQTVKSQIQRMAGWESCTTCAGIGANGPTATISTAAGVASPSASGNSRVFYLASSKPYADALWWKQLGAANAATNLKYDLDFYIKAPQNAQALEFDNNQANGKMRWIFGTQCNIAAKVWDVWGNVQGNWISTGIGCAMPAAFKWHHLTWQFKRTATTLTYISFTLDGVTHYVNRTYTGRKSTVNELNVAFQMDNKANHAAYNTWLDNVKLTYW